MAKETGNKGLGDREKQIIYILVGLIIVALAYFFGFTRFNENRAVLVEENAKLQDEVKELRDMEANRAKVEQDTQDDINAVGEIYGDYPVELRTQNLIDYFDKIEKNHKNLDFKSETFTLNMIYFQNGAVLESEVDSKELPEAVSAQESAGSTENTAEAETAPVLDENGLPKEVTGYRSSVAVTFSTNYTELKKILEDVNKYPKRTTISDINIASPEGMKEMTCSMTVNMYSVDGIEGTYDDLRFPEVQTGKQNIFK